MENDPIGAAEIFTIFFVTLGPLKILGPFVQRTHDLDESALRKVALWAFVIATIAAVAGSALGRVLAANWHISTPSLVIAAGIIFLLVALKQLLETYEPARIAESPAPLPPSPMAAALRLLFPIVLTPYGIAVVIVLLASNRESERIELIIGLLVLVMIFNLLAMLFARRILHGFTMVVLQVLGAVLGVLQAGLAVEFIIHGLRGLRIIGDA